MELEQGVAHGLGDPLAHGSFVMELHFAFGRVNVDIDFRGIGFDKEAANGVAAFHQGSVVAFEQGKIDAAVFHGPPVDENVLVLPG